jgi:hypothetical protein
MNTNTVPGRRIIDRIMPGSMLPLSVVWISREPAFFDPSDLLVQLPDAP